MRVEICSVYSNNNDHVDIGLRFLDAWFSQNISWVDLRVKKSTKMIEINDINYDSCDEAEDCKAILESEGYKKAVMDIAIEQSLKGE
jgi:hypothetical protein